MNMGHSMLSNKDLYDQAKADSLRSPINIAMYHEDIRCTMRESSTTSCLCPRAFLCPFPLHGRSPRRASQVVCGQVHQHNGVQHADLNKEVGPPRVKRVKLNPQPRKATKHPEGFARVAAHALCVGSMSCALHRRAIAKSLGRDAA